MADLQISNLRKRFGVFEVLKGISLDVNDGEFVSFLGPSGCGKSTLLRIISGLESQQDGAIVLGGRNIADVPAAKRDIAMVFQNYALYPHMNVYKNLSFGLALNGMKKAEIAARVTEAANILQISELLDRKPRQLSGGQRQRVAIGRAIVREPTLFLLDEPLSNLDANLRVSMRAELSVLHKRLRTTMIYVTHDQVEAMTLSDRVVVLNQGEVAQFGRPLELFHTPANMFVAGFIGSPRMNFFDAVVSESGADVLHIDLKNGVAPISVEIAGPVDLSSGASVTVGIRPEHIEITASDDCHFKGQVTLVERLGSESHVHAQLDGAQKIVAVVDGVKAVAAHQDVCFRVSPQHCHVFDPQGKAIPRRLNSELAAVIAKSA
ncbi:ABC transporter ATP-binding protein [Pelagibacterium sp.]|uniref:ABC transporter ATP-binding protein n=1 Tax=Pelagibacterium sp. TaxID=1967288 RepID=UPI003A91379D